MLCSPLRQLSAPQQLAEGLESLPPSPLSRPLLTWPAGVALLTGGFYVVSLFGLLWADLMRSPVWDSPKVGDEALLCPGSAFERL